MHGWLATQNCRRAGIAMELNLNNFLAEFRSLSRLLAIPLYHTGAAIPAEPFSNAFAELS